MNTIRVLTVLALSASTGAFAQVISFDAALARAGDVASVQLALQEQRDAHEHLQRITQDPLATRVELVQAQQRAALATARASRAPKVARAQITSAFVNVLGAQASVPFTQKSVQVAEQGLNIAQIRQRNGSGAAQAVRDAQNQLDDVRRNLASAQANLSLARQALRDLIGPFTDLQAPTDLPCVPGANVIEQLLGESPNLLQARQNVTLSELQLSVTDPSYTARKDIEAARSQVESARKNLTTAQMSERQAVQGLFDKTVQASRDVTVLRQNAVNANAKLQNDRRRLQSGVISPFELLQSELSAQQADLSALQGRNDYLRHYYSLLAGGGQ